MEINVVLYAYPCVYNANQWVPWSVHIKPVAAAQRTLIRVSDMHCEHKAYCTTSRMPSY